MQAHKTISVCSLKDTINSMLATSTCAPDVRKGMIGALETILHATGNYHGFAYLESKDVPAGYRAGVNGLGSEMEYDQLFNNTDRTRVVYI